MNVAPALPGRPCTFHATDVEYTATYFTDTVAGCLDAPDLEDIVIVGESIGGSVTLALAARTNPRVARWPSCLSIQSWRERSCSVRRRACRDGSGGDRSFRGRRARRDRARSDSVVPASANAMRYCSSGIRSGANPDTDRPRDREARDILSQRIDSRANSLDESSRAAVWKTRMIRRITARTPARAEG